MSEQEKSDTPHPTGLEEHEVENARIIADALANESSHAMEAAIQNAKLTQKQNRARRLTGKQERRLAYWLGIRHALLVMAIQGKQAKEEQPIPSEQDASQNPKS